MNKTSISNKLVSILEHLQGATLDKSEVGFPTDNDNIVLLKKNDPLSAVETYSRTPIYKYSYHPKTHEVLYSYPNEYHSDAIGRAGKTKKFDEYVRAIYDRKRNVIGTRPWGLDDLGGNNEDTIKRSYNAQYDAYKFFAQNHPRLKWVYDITNSDLTRSTEQLESKNVATKRILSESQSDKFIKGKI